MKRADWMVTIIAWLAVVFLAAGSVFASDYEITKKAGQYTLNVRIDRNPPVAGKNNVAIEIKDGAGKVVTDATVALDYSMPPMPGMPPMNYKAAATLKGRKYVATLDLPMPGSWNIILKITRGDQTQTARFTVDAK